MSICALKLGLSHKMQFIWFLNSIICKNEKKPSDCLNQQHVFRNNTNQSSKLKVTNTQFCVQPNHSTHNSPKIIRYNMIRDAILTCNQKLTWVSLIYSMEPTLSTFVNVQGTKVHVEKCIHCGQLILRIISKSDATSIGADTMGHVSPHFWFVVGTAGHR